MQLGGSLVAADHCVVWQVMTQAGGHIKGLFHNALLDLVAYDTVILLEDAGVLLQAM